MYFWLLLACDWSVTSNTRTPNRYYSKNSSDVSKRPPRMQCTKCKKFHITRIDCRKVSYIYLIWSKEQQTK